MTDISSTGRSGICTLMADENPPPPGGPYECEYPPREELYDDP
eukprot:CAMPEP_0185803920 /NCGR_PEP_ID=MMETSP1322-20130828/2953_1 /TAXON_ID=265543 /ORGANISM="Minutocellus polymorphus, Strain RCC2270" /LENGTH=42 /DNA_ID= /DNA_START= /DNA_END= /DNA_ORIENTATION=